MLTELKDGALALALKAYLNDQFADYGEVLECSIESVKNRICVEAMMRGEAYPVTAAVERYEIKRDSAGAYIVLHEFSSSREWLTRLLTRLFASKRYALPGPIGALL